MNKRQVATGEVLGKTAPGHTSARFVAFLAEVVSAQPAGKEIHVICDNVSSHKTDAVQTVLADYTNDVRVPPLYPPREAAVRTFRYASQVD